MGIDIASIVGSARQAFVAAGLGPKDLLAAADNSRIMAARWAHSG
jgi:hypothetical protein